MDWSDQGLSLVQNEPHLVQETVTLSVVDRTVPGRQQANVIPGDLEQEIVTPQSNSLDSKGKLLKLLKERIMAHPLCCELEDDYGVFCVLSSQSLDDFSPTNFHILDHVEDLARYKHNKTEKDRHHLRSKVQTIQQSDQYLSQSSLWDASAGGADIGEVMINGKKYNSSQILISDWSYQDIARREIYCAQIDGCFAELCKSSEFHGNKEGNDAQVFAVVTRAHRASLVVRSETNSSMVAETIPAQVENQMLKQYSACIGTGVVGIQVRYFKVGRDEQGVLRVTRPGYHCVKRVKPEDVPEWLFMERSLRMVCNLGDATVLVNPKNNSLADGILKQIVDKSPDEPTSDGQCVTLVQAISNFVDSCYSAAAVTSTFILKWLWPCLFSAQDENRSLTCGGSLIDRWQQGRHCPSDSTVITLGFGASTIVALRVITWSKNSLRSGGRTWPRCLRLSVVMLSLVPACGSSLVERICVVENILPAVVGVAAGLSIWFGIQKTFGRKTVILEDPSGITLVPHSPEALYNSEFDQYMRWTELENDNVRSQVNKERALEALLKAVNDLYYRGDVDIKPLVDSGSGDGKGAKSLLDAVDDSNELKRALAEQLFSVDPNDPSLRIRLGREEDGTVKVSANIHNYQQLARVRNHCLNGEAERKLADSLKKAGELEEEITPNIEFDKTSIALMFEKLILRLESMTDHQREVLRGCDNERRLHIEAPAGTGKTFVAVNQVLKYIENSDGDERVLYVCRNASLGFQFSKWLCNRIRKQNQRVGVLKRIGLLTVAQPDKVNGIGYDANRDLLVEMECDEQSFSMIVVDEAHDVFRLDSSLHTGVEEVLDKNKEANWLFLSDRSQSESGAVELDDITSRGEWKSVKLTEVVRSTVRIMLGAKCFQLSAVDVRSFAHEHDGLPPVPVFFSAEPNSLFGEYVKHICSSIEKVRETFPGLDLSDRLAVIVPDIDFLEGLRRANLEVELKRLSLCSITAETASRTLMVGKEESHDGTSESRILVDTVEEMNGLERLVVFGVGFDKPISDLAAPARRAACSRIYRAITRAQLLFYFINEEIEGGWYEWMAYAEFDGKNGRLGYERESEKVTNLAAVKLLSIEKKDQSNISSKTVSGEKTVQEPSKVSATVDRADAQQGQMSPELPSSEESLTALRATGSDREEKTEREIPKISTRFLDTSNTTFKRRTRELHFNPLKVTSTSPEADVVDVMSISPEAGVVFVSHAGGDESGRNFAAYLKRTLDDENIPAFYDVESIPYAVDFEKHIENQVKNCTAFVAILSPTYFKRYWCMRELHLALSHERLVLPVYYAIDGDEDFPQDEQFFCGHFSSDKRVAEKELHEWWISVHEKLPKIQGLRRWDPSAMNADMVLIDKIVKSVKELTKIKYVKADTGDSSRVQNVSDSFKERYDFLGNSGYPFSTLLRDTGPPEYVGELWLADVADPRAKWHMKSEPYVFVSHTGRDGSKEDIARPTSWFLSTVCGVRSFLDALDIYPGYDQTREVMQPAYECTHALVILSPKYRTRRYCIQELNTFMKRNQQEEDFRILPVLWKLENVDGYHRDVDDLAWIASAEFKDSPVDFLLVVLWPALLRVFSGPPLNEGELEEKLFEYIQSHRGGASRISPHFERFAKYYDGRRPQQTGWP